MFAGISSRRLATMELRENLSHPTRRELVKRGKHFVPSAKRQSHDRKAKGRKKSIPFILGTSMELKPCPFCGGEAAQVITDIGPGFQTSIVRCKTCPAQIAKTGLDAGRYWDRRAKKPMLTIFDLRDKIFRNNQ